MRVDQRGLPSTQIVASIPYASPPYILDRSYLISNRIGPWPSIEVACSAMISRSGNCPDMLTIRTRSSEPTGSAIGVS